MAKLIVNGQVNTISGGMLSEVFDMFGVNAENVKVTVDGMEIPSDSKLQLHNGLKEIVIENFVAVIATPEPVVRVIVTSTTVKALNEGKMCIYETLPTKKELRYAQRVIDINVAGEVVVVWERNEE